METNLILFSGGIDSRVCVELMKDVGYNTQGIGFDYGQPHVIELEYAKKYAETISMPYQIVKLPILTKADDVVFCARNAIMLSVAFSIAQSNNINNVTIGVNNSDDDRFPDCRIDFIAGMNMAAKAYNIKIHAPLLYYTKTDIIKLSKKYNIDLLNTWTCYSPTENGEQCGECYSCLGKEDANSKS